MFDAALIGPLDEVDRGRFESTGNLTCRRRASAGELEELEELDEPQAQNEPRMLAVTDVLTVLDALDVPDVLDVLTVIGMIDMIDGSAPRLAEGVACTSGSCSPNRRFSESPCSWLMGCIKPGPSCPSGKDTSWCEVAEVVLCPLTRR